ncbi:MAG: acetylxylan esterase [Chthonomonas sp.]|nr:acetylxylan esterase [Chthonomonas sp.]
MTPYVPEDFDQFWAEVVEEARAVPLDFRRSRRNDFVLDGFFVETIWFQSVQGRTVEGWLAIPRDGEVFPGFVWSPPYGRESLLPNRYGTRAGMVSLSLNFHGHGAFHQEKYTPTRGYFADGADDPNTWVFRRMFQDAFIAARVLEAQLEVDERQIAAMGMSQGAGLSLWLGAHCPIVRAVAADMPFLGAMPDALSRNAYRYPLKELIDYMETIPFGRERVLYTISYFDTMNQATRVRVPTLISRGLKDPACRPENVQAIYDAVPAADKQLVTYDWGHDWHPDMVENNRDFVLRALKSELS